MEWEQVRVLLQKEPALASLEVAFEDPLAPEKENWYPEDFGALPLQVDSLLVALLLGLVQGHDTLLLDPAAATFLVPVGVVLDLPPQILQYRIDCR